LATNAITQGEEVFLMPGSLPALLSFEEHYFERIWGGRGLEDLLGKSLLAGAPIGEAWLVADHPQCESVVNEGPRTGWTLRRLVKEEGPALLGAHAQTTPYGRFPLLLKLLDAQEVLSVQVHPNDALAALLGEPDVGKTEMWHVLRANDGALLYCGLAAGVDRDRFVEALAGQNLDNALVSMDAVAGQSLYVPAGTVHAIGGGCLLAEIQQNSDITYRCHDWGRTDERGNPRELHVEKALRAIRFGEPHPGPVTPLMRETPGARIETHAACAYFAAERIRLDGVCTRNTRGDSFRILLGLQGALQVSAGGESRSLAPGDALLVAGHVTAYTLDGIGEVMDYFVPVRDADIVAPLEEAGHDHATIARVLLDRWLP
jgi:mannose-6-phosphate isomerase